MVQDIRTVGLLGGAFNPPHHGHVHISCEAKKRLGLDEVWWLVTPDHPLKRDPMPSLSTRMEWCETLCRDRRFITISALEARLGTRFTVDTVRRLQKRFPYIRFVWLMGADNLQSFHMWKRWSQLPHMVPIATLDRPHYALHALNSRAAMRFRKYRLSATQSHALAWSGLPRWVFLPIRTVDISSTQLRENAEWRPQ